MQRVLRQDRDKLRQLQKSQPHFSQEQRRELMEVHPWLRRGCLPKAIDIKVDLSSLPVTLSPLLFLVLSLFRTLSPLLYLPSIALLSFLFLYSVDFFVWLYVSGVPNSWLGEGSQGTCPCTTIFSFKATRR